MNNKRKEHCNISTIGHVDHGKTTLSEALTKYFSIYGTAVRKKYSEIDSAPEEKARGVTINASHIEYSSKKRHFSQTDCPGHHDYIKNMITGNANMDGAILVISINGIQPQTVEHILLASNLGIKKLIVFVNKIDTVDEEDRELMIEIIKADIEELCKKYKYTNVPIIVGSALAFVEQDLYVDEMHELAKLLDEYIECTAADINQPLLISVEGAVTIPGRGTVATGKIVRGKIDLENNKDGQPVILVGPNKKQDIETVITSMQVFHKKEVYGLPGDDMGVLLRGVKKEDVNRGDIICEKGSVTKHDRFRCIFYALRHDEGGRKKPFKAEYKPQFFIRTLDITGTFKEIKDQEIVNPGDHVEAIIELQYPVPIEDELNFITREGGFTVGAGKIIEKL